MWLLYINTIYIVIWLKHHGNRLYGVIGLLSKKSDEWMDWMDTPQTVMTTRVPVVLITGKKPWIFLHFH